MIRSGFFNSVDGDRKYNASKYAEYFASFIGNGVFPTPTDGLQVVSNDDMTVTVKMGKAWIDGYIMINDDDYILTVDPADGLLNRIDRVVARLDTVDREIRVEIKKGTFASTPVAPTLQRDADAYELGIADLAINAGVVSIFQASITDLRSNSEFCGKVDSIIAGDINTLAEELGDHVDASNPHSGSVSSAELLLHVEDETDVHGIVSRLQVVTVVNSVANPTTTSSTYQDSGLSVSITPKSNNSKIIVTVDGVLYYDELSTSRKAEAKCNIAEGASNILQEQKYNAGSNYSIGAGYSTGQGPRITPIALKAVYDNADLDPKTFKLQFAAGVDTATVIIRNNIGSIILTAMEVL